MVSQLLVAGAICMASALLVTGIPEAAGIFALYAGMKFSLNKACFYSMMFLLVNYGIVHVLRLSIINYLNAFLAISIVFVQVHYGNSRLYKSKTRTQNLVMIIVVTTPIYYVIESITDYLMLGILMDGLSLSIINIFWYVLVDIAIAFAVFESNKHSSRMQAFIQQKNIQQQRTTTRIGYQASLYSSWYSKERKSNQEESKNDSQGEKNVQ